ncbi:MAG TPA: tetratricopeptide repeat protein [Gemmataceae bacterium]|nr:tetratricopeptide repeat protein [Gemmataceae bacterium]
MRKTFALLSLALLAGTARPQPVDRDKLRQAAWMPKVSVMAGIGFNSADGFAMMGEKRDLKPEIAALRKQLKGGADDADRYFRLAELCDRDKDQKAAQEAYAKAAGLYRELLRAKPDNSRLLTRLAICLEDNDPQKETLLRRAVAVGPKDWEAWIALGDHLQGKAITVLFGDPGGGRFKFSMEAWFAMLFQKRPPPERIDKSLKLLDEAAGCFDKALATDPKSSDAWAHCGMARCWQGVMRGSFRILKGEKVNPLAEMFAPPHLAEFRRAAELAPDDYRAVGWAAWYEAFSYALHNNLNLLGDDKRLWDALPEKNRASVKAAMERLDRLAQGGDKSAAAGSLELLGVLYVLVMKDMAAGETCYRRAIELAPDRDSAWEMLLAILAMQDRHEEIVKVAQAYVKQKDTAHSRYLLAKGHERLNQLDKAEEAVRAALKRDPDSPQATLGLAAILLKRGDGPSLAEAAQTLDRAEQLVQKDGAANYRIDYVVNRSIYLGLTGEAETAKRLLAQVLEKDRQNEPARKALKALER